MRKQRKDHSNGGLRLDTSAKSAAFGRKTLEALCSRLTALLPTCSLSAQYRQSLQDCDGYLGCGWAAGEAICSKVPTRRPANEAGWVRPFRRWIVFSVVGAINDSDVVA
jgi:hypothetical protein